MPAWLSGSLTFVILAAGLALLLPALRKGKPARSWGDLSSYDGEAGPMWAVALIAGFALAQIVSMATGGTDTFLLLGLLVGFWCGLFRKPTRMAGIVPGIIGGVASVLGSIAFVTDATSPRDVAFRLGIGLALGLLFVLGIINRVQPLGGLTWFAALELVMFVTAPAGVSWLGMGSVEKGTLFLVGIGFAVALAFLPEVAIGLAAIGVGLVQIAGSATGLIPGSVGDTFIVAMATMIGYFVTRVIRGLFR